MTDGVNTIYDYYEKVNDKYFIARSFPCKGKRDVVHFWQPLAKTVRIRGYEDFDFFIIKEGNYLMLYEGLTGGLILRQCDLQSRIMRRCNLKLFIDCLPAELARAGGRGAVNQVIANFIFDAEQIISPRYIVKEL